jgi:hypothetical protein
MLLYLNSQVGRSGNLSIYEMTYLLCAIVDIDQGKGTPKEAQPYRDCLEEVMEWADSSSHLARNRHERHPMPEEPCMVADLKFPGTPQLKDPKHLLLAFYHACKYPFRERSKRETHIKGAVTSIILWLIISGKTQDAAQGLVCHMIRDIVPEVVEIGDKRRYPDVIVFEIGGLRPSYDPDGIE